MKLAKQIAAIVLLAALFAAFDLAIYFAFTKRYINNTSPEMQAK